MPRWWDGSGRVSDGMAVVLAMLADGVDAGLSGRSAAACVRALAVTGIGIRAATGIPAGAEGGGEPVWSSGQMVVPLDHLELTLGEGPGVDAATGSMALSDDLADEARWPMYSPAACELGVRASFAFPLRVGAIQVGVLVAYRTTAGPLSAQQLTDAQIFADAVTFVMLDGSGPDPTVTPRWVSDSPRPERVQIHQATGMISVQLGISLTEALIRLRAYAYSNGRPIDTVASDVVTRRLRFDKEPR